MNQNSERITAMAQLAESQGWSMLTEELSKERDYLYQQITTGTKVSERISAADKLSAIDKILMMPYEIIKEEQEMIDGGRNYEVGEVEL